VAAAFGWDFGPSGPIWSPLRCMAGSRPAASCRRRRVEGYGYFVSEDRKGLIGDLFVRRSTARRRTRPPHPGGRENCCAIRHPRVSRNDDAAFGDRYALPFLKAPVGLPAQLMVLDAALAAGLNRAGRRQAQFDVGPPGVRMRPPGGSPPPMPDTWDGNVNDRTARSGAAAVLANIVPVPPRLRNVLPAASFVGARRLDRFGLRSLADQHAFGGERACHADLRRAAPQREGLGYELMRRSLLAFSEAGCRKVSLTVTAANTEAVQLYERIGFRSAHEFPALVWTGVSILTARCRSRFGARR